MEPQSSSDSSKSTWLITLGVIVLVILPAYFGAHILRERTHFATTKVLLSPKAITNVQVPVDQLIMERELGCIVSTSAMTQVLKSLRLLPSFVHAGIPPQAPETEALNSLRRLVKVQHKLGSSVLVISAYSPDPQLSADIANQIAQTYFQDLQTRTNQFRVSLIQQASAATARRSNLKVINSR